MVIKPNHVSIPTGISLSKELISQIDRERGDVPRSRYISRLIENNLQKRDGVFGKKLIPVDQSSKAKDQQASIVRSDD